MSKLNETDLAILTLLEGCKMRSVDIEFITMLSQSEVGDSISRLSDMKKIEPNIVDMVLYWQVKEENK